MMKPTLAALFFAVACTSAAAAAPEKKEVPTGTDIGQRVPQFSAQLIDVSADPPRNEKFDSHTTKHLTAYIFVGTGCPATNAYAERFKQLAETYTPKGVDFVYIYPNREDNTETKIAFHKGKQLGGRLIDDQGAVLAHLFKAQRTSELFVTDKQGVVVYHGAVDDAREPSAVKQRYLATALDEVLAGKPVTTSASQVSA